MGNSSSHQISQQEYCKAQALESKRCMNSHDFNRDVYRKECRDQFEAYRECKQKWGQIMRQLSNTENEPVER